MSYDIFPEWLAVGLHYFKELQNGGPHGPVLIAQIRFVDSKGHTEKILLPIHPSHEDREQGGGRLTAAF